MQARNDSRFVRFVLLSNGAVDLFAAVALFFPVLNLPLPGYASYTSELAFAAGGWGIATLALGAGRIWASDNPEFHWMMVVLGLLEGIPLATYCLIGVFLLEVSLLQAMLPLAVGSIFGALYIVALLALLRLRRSC